VFTGITLVFDERVRARARERERERKRVREKGGEGR